MFVCSFDSVSHLTGRQRTYKNIKAAVLAAGRFSCFDVNTEKDGRIFTKLCNDPELKIMHEEEGYEYPWTGVRLKEVTNDTTN